MAIAGALVVPVSREIENDLTVRLKSLQGVEVETSGPNGIAVVMEAESSNALKKLSKDIGNWEEVVDFQLAYLNWEELEAEK